MILYNHHLMLFPPTYIYVIFRRYHSVQFSSVAQSCPTLCGPMNCSMPGLRVHYQLLEFTQTNVHRVGDAIQPSCPLSSPSPPASNPSQHQSFPVSQLFAWGGWSIGVSALASFLPRGMEWGGRREGGSGWGTHVYLWQIHFDIWQN